MPEVARTILYYPTIEIPTVGIWLRQALLYWDRVASVVPRSWDDYADEQAMQRYSPDIRYLYEEAGVFRPINPDLLLNSEASKERFKKEFTSRIESAGFKRLLPPQDRRRCTEKIFKQKVSQELFKLLNKHGLAEERNKNRDDYYCYYFEPHTSLLYMTLLSKYLAAEDEDYTITGTDIEPIANTSYQALQKRGADVCISAVLKNVLPVPSEHTPLKKVLKFKKAHCAQLLEFRTQVDEFEEHLKSCEDERHLKAETVSFNGKIQRDIELLRASMRRSYISTVFGALHSFIKPTSPALVGTAAVIAGKATSLTTVPIEWLAIGAATAGAIEVGAHLIKKLEERNDEVNKRAFSYIYLAEKKLKARR